MSGSGDCVPLLDPSFPFLERRLPGVKCIDLLDSCNGILLFGCRRKDDTLRYIVCNPATEELVIVPASSDANLSASGRSAYTYLIFHPAVSSRFHLVQFWWEIWEKEVGEVCSYSSETKTWSSKWKRGGKARERGLWVKTTVKHSFGVAFLNGLLHFVVERAGKWDNLRIVPVRTKKNLIVAVDEEGKLCRSIRWPDKHVAVSAFICQSQGHLHCISPNVQHNDFTQLAVWVLEDYDAHEWILKHNVSTLQLFGSLSHKINDVDIVAIHSDHNSLIILVQHWNRKLVSYNTGSKERRVLCTLGEGYRLFTPYVPCFMESPVFATKR